MGNPTKRCRDTPMRTDATLCRVAAAGEPWDDRQQGSDQEADQ